MILQELRERTRVHHQTLESEADLMSPSLSRERYLELLAGFFGFYHPIEQLLERAADWGSLGIDFEARRKSGRAREDLLALGLPDARVERLPSCPAARLPRLESPDEALGCMYVLEGATLGGVLISRHLLATLGIGPADGASFFQAYGAEVGAMWRAFQAALSGQVRHPEQRERAVRAACHTFDAFGSWLRERRGEERRKEETWPSCPAT